MFLSARQAADVLAAGGVTRRQTRTLLGAGLAGAPVVTRAAHLYPETAVRELAARSTLVEEEIAAACPSLLFVARRVVDVRTSREEQLSQLANDWDLGMLASNLAMLCHIRLRGPVPFVATVCGFVALGAEIGRLWCVPSETTYRMELKDPGEWFAAFAGRRLRLGPGRDFVLRGW